MLRAGQPLTDKEGENATLIEVGPTARTPEGFYRVRYSWGDPSKDGMILHRDFFRAVGDRVPVRTFHEYGLEAETFATYPYNGPNNYVYPALALAGEAGEVAGKLAKAIRDDGGEITPGRRASLLLELGDVLWNLNALAAELGFSLSEVANANLDKLEGRRTRGTLGGEGDDR